MADKVWTAGNKVARLGEWFRLTQEQWADVVGVSRGAIAAYKHRHNASPSTDKIRKLATRFGVPMAWFFDGKDTDPPVPNVLEDAERQALDGQALPVPPDKLSTFMRAFAANAEVALPVWRGVAAGSKEEEAGFLEDSIEDPISVPAFFVSGKDPANFIVCLPTGTSMAPRIIQGDRVITRLETNPEPNSIVVAKRPDGLNFIKVFKLVHNMPELHSLNGKFPVICELDDWTLRGVVVGIWKPYITGDLNIEFMGGVPLRG